MSKFYQVTLAFEEEQENGKVKERKEQYIVEDEDPTAATAVAVDEYGTHETFRVVSVTETRIKDVLPMRQHSPQKQKSFTRVTVSSGNDTLGELEVG